MQYDPMKNGALRVVTLSNSLGGARGVVVLLAGEVGHWRAAQARGHHKLRASPSPLSASGMGLTGGWCSLLLHSLEVLPPFLLKPHAAQGGGGDKMDSACSGRRRVPIRRQGSF